MTFALENETSSSPQAVATIVLLPIIKCRYQSALHRYKTTRELSRMGKRNIKVLLYFSPARRRPFSHLAFSTRWWKEGLAPLDWTIKSLLTLQNCQPLFIRHVHPLFWCDDPGGATVKGESLVNVIRSLSCHVNESQAVIFSKNGCNWPSNVTPLAKNYFAKDLNNKIYCKNIKERHNYLS